MALESFAVRQDRSGSAEMLLVMTCGFDLRSNRHSVHAVFPGVWENDTDTVDMDSLKPLVCAELTATAAAENPFDAEKQAADYMAPLSAKDRPRVTTAMNQFVPVSYLLKIRPDDWAPAVVLLHRAGWSDASLVGLTIADQRARSFWQLRPWTEPDIVFDPTGEYANSKTEEQAWSNAHKTLTLEAPAMALRRALYRFCKAQITRDDPVLAPDVALGCALACLDPKDPQGNADRLKALRASRDIPARVAPDAPLLARLQSWDGVQQRPRMVVRNGGGANGSVSMSTSFEAPSPSYTPVEQDLDALVALLGDGRPSRWVDFAGARSVGDNAWRALAVILKKDPRVLAGMPTGKPWTAAERVAEAKAFQAWWKKHHADVRPSATNPK